MINTKIVLDIMNDTLKRVPEPVNFKEYRDSFKAPRQIEPAVKEREEVAP
jgi:hypothetical protein